MGLCDTVALLADTVAAAHAPLSAREHALHARLRAMPQHLAAGDLGAWEAGYQEAVPDHPAPRLPERLLDDVFDLGRHNLYRAFDVAGTAAEVARVVAVLRQGGVEVPVIQPPRTW